MEKTKFIKYISLNRILKKISRIKDQDILREIIRENKVVNKFIEDIMLNDEEILKNTKNKIL
tara:strand:- start:1249 stop:1434 length:186 start_codon:yes stop_codon:yes gene_type:complete